MVLVVADGALPLRHSLVLAHHDVLGDFVKQSKRKKEKKS